MNRTCYLLVAGLLCHGALLAQEPVLYQQAVSLAAGRGGRGMGMPPGETGKPFSATATTTTTQTLLDGTRLNQVMTMVEYRDAEGRVRTETTEPGAAAGEHSKIIMIRDPVAGLNYRLDTARKSAMKTTMALAGPLTVAGGGMRGGRGGGVPGTTPEITIAGARGRSGNIVPAVAAPLDGTPRNIPNVTTEDLGTQSVNGVPARGTRVTTVVPVGEIGNDRELRSVSERWFSSELNLLIKSVNTDPRFGTTTYELTNISRQPPVPSLFQVPSDYNIVF